MRNRFLLQIVLIAAMLAGAASAHAERRVALVVGNAAYSHAATLRNPRNDATDVAAALRQLGFEVLLGVDLDQQQFARKIDEFGRALDQADVALFYYAGHGLQINDKNYLVSTKAELSSEFLVSAETIELDGVIRLMESRSQTSMIFLDACRNNPLAEKLRRNLVAQKRGAVFGRGLARVEPSGHDTLVAFAAAPGQEAADGSERNSPFTGALLKYLPTPGLEVSVMLKDVSAEVRRSTGNSQRPQQLSDMSRAFYFAKAETGPVSVPVAAVKPPELATPALPARDSQAFELAFWSGAQAANECEAVRAYLHRFPDGGFVDLARISERRLCAGRRVTMIEADQPPASASAQPAPAAQAPPSTPSGGAGGGQLAALPDAPVETPAAATSANPEATDAGLPRRIQLELIRLGCSTEEADGAWGTDSRGAVRRFNRHSKAKLDAEKPSPWMLATLRQRHGRVCPLNCDDGFRVRGNSCVAIAPAKPRRAERTPEPRIERRQPQANTRSYEAPRASRVAPVREHARRREAPAAARPPQGTVRGGLRCRFVGIPTGGGYNGDTKEVCD